MRDEVTRYPGMVISVHDTGHPELARDLLFRANKQIPRKLGMTGARFWRSPVVSAVVLLAAACAVPGPAAAQARRRAPLPWSDVSRGHWAYAVLDRVAD